MKIDAQNLTDRIEINPEVLAGKPLIKGTRISVEQIMRMLASGMKQEEILTEFSHLEQEDIRAAMLYASDLIQDFQAYPRQYIHRIKFSS